MERKELMETLKKEIENIRELKSKIIESEENLVRIYGALYDSKIDDDEDIIKVLKQLMRNNIITKEEGVLFLMIKNIDIKDKDGYTCIAKSEFINNFNMTDQVINNKIDKINYKKFNSILGNLENLGLIKINKNGYKTITFEEYKEKNYYGYALEV